MNAKEQKGLIGEMRAMTHFIALGYEVFIALNGKSEFDFIAYKDHIATRVSVKATASKDAKSGSYRLQIGQRRSDNKKSFDPASCDILAAYIIPEDRIVLIPSAAITNKYQINIKPDASVM